MNRRVTSNVSGKAMDPEGGVRLNAPIPEQQMQPEVCHSFKLAEILCFPGPELIGNTTV